MLRGPQAAHTAFSLARKRLQPRPPPPLRGVTGLRRGLRLRRGPQLRRWPRLPLRLRLCARALRFGSALFIDSNVLTPCAAPRAAQCYTGAASHHAPAKGGGTATTALCRRCAVAHGYPRCLRCTCLSAGGDCEQGLDCRNLAATGLGIKLRALVSKPLALVGKPLALVGKDGHGRRKALANAARCLSQGPGQAASAARHQQRPHSHRCARGHRPSRAQRGGARRGGVARTTGKLGTRQGEARGAADVEADAGTGTGERRQRKDGRRQTRCGSG